MSADDSVGFADGETNSPKDQCRTTEEKDGIAWQVSEMSIECKKHHQRNEEREGDDDDDQKAETNGNGTAAGVSAAGIESEESSPFVDAPSAAESNGNGNNDEFLSTTITDLTGFDTDGDALHLRYSSILRGALSPSPSKEVEEE